MKVFMLDNLDSFTYNLVDEFRVLGLEPVIYRNTLSADFIIKQMQTCEQQVLLVLSPGPGEPGNAGCLMELIAKTAGQFPILGICLGHQALVQHYGGTVGRAPEIVHGKSSPVFHSGSGAFENISNPLPVARYHSLVATSVPEQLEVIAHFTATTASDQQINLPMAIQHSQDNALGFQFHPESILTTYGSHLLAQSIRYLIGQHQEKPQQGAAHG
ncbi:aminodeoxychorismate/anthranilate synthase component II [Thalassomonas actiniarum]|uniref:anthranilate synthase n=1 Tax=Thalassomonas actiniarum TaxID=485447 RepID=A0AAF0C6D2_9GAMM|nr:aminodeoxychorismate/anthranilate synthase component II [Thalassomonas actiniarum]WDE01920.1 aminodeoxychorismate/anthranilate synthase component II [Thalassomonas actiniarum]